MGVYLRGSRDRGELDLAAGTLAPVRVDGSLDADALASIETIARREWDALFDDELEDWHYLRALERARLEDCEPLYCVVRSRGRCLAAAPAYIERAALVLGSPFAGTCVAGFAPSTDSSQKATLLAALLRGARELSVRLGLDRLVAMNTDMQLDDLWAGAAAPQRLRRANGTPLIRLALPPWELDDYLCALGRPVRAELLGVCERSAGYERGWRVDLARDSGPLLDLCRRAGHAALTAACFENLLGPGVCASCLVVRVDGTPIAFSVVLHDARRLREKLTVVDPRADGRFVGALIWLETIRFCLECGIESHESPSPWSIAAARHGEVLARSSWLGEVRPSVS